MAEVLGRAFGMGEQDFTPRGDESFCERMGNAMVGMCFGVLLFIAAFPLLGWNEKRAVYRAETIDRARDDMVVVEPGCTTNSKYNDQLISIVACNALPGNFPGSSSPPGVATDRDLTAGLVFSGASPSTTTGVYPTWKLTAKQSESDLIGWSRSAQRRVCKETAKQHCTTNKKTKKKTCTTTYEYDITMVSYGSSSVWRGPNAASECKSLNGGVAVGRPDQYNDYNGFKSLSNQVEKVCLGPDNATALKCDSSSTGGKNQWVIDDAWKSSIRDLSGYTNVAIAAGTKDAGTTYSFGVCNSQYLVTAKKGGGPDCTSSGRMVADPSGWGDFRFSFQYKKAPSNGVSVLAKQLEDPPNSGVYKFVEWQNPDHSDCSYCRIGEISSGSKTGDEYLDELESDNTTTTWVLRFVGFLIMWCGLQLCVAPISLAPEAIPVVGEFIGALIGKILMVATCCLAIGLTLMVVAIAWLAFRPAIGIPLLLVCCLSMGAVAFLANYKRKEYQKHKSAASFQHPATTQMQPQAPYQTLEQPGGQPAYPGVQGGGYPGPPPPPGDGEC
eukprot:TRINITY_DN1503_c0_g1_i1.p1 TRINITY_DN1503_c0_g1~~TRINITY_DN1503_c0_g1_i1.p1  ORF type:complete len:594 (+),score=170.01 TRINITY_DN1503_c0_g1_i1:120-1784(+)